MERFKVAPGTVQETLMMPLYGRVYCDEHFPNTFPNAAAVRAAQNVDYDFKKVESSELNMVTWGLRARMLQDAAKEYLQEHPKASIINLGCGLDLSFDAVYKPFGHVPAERVLSPEVIGITDPIAVQVRNAAYQVGAGMITVEEAVSQYGSF